jgi:uncharacterized membrane protein
MDDRRLESIIGQLLRAGVLLAAATVFVGGIFYLVQHSSDRAGYHAFVEGAPGMHTLPGILQGAAQGNSLAIIQVGLLLLILTPVGRVAIALAGFLMERDRLYSVVSLIVLMILLLSLMHAS